MYVHPSSLLNFVKIAEKRILDFWELKFRVTLCHVLEFPDAWLLSDLSQVVYKTSDDHSVIVLHKNNGHYLKSLFWRHEIEFSRFPP